MPTVDVAAQQVWWFGTYLNSEMWNDFHTVVRDQAGLQGCNTDGFTGLISPLQGSMGWLHRQSDELLDEAVKRLHSTSRGLINTAYSYAGMDHSNREVLEDVPDNKRRPTPGTGPGITFGGGPNPYTNPDPVVAKPISAEGTTITEEMDAKTRGDAAQAINWIVRHFSEQLGLGGKDLRQMVIEPLSGDYNRIRANGKAWEDVGRMLNTVLTNLSRNAGLLVTSDWTGDAAQAFLEHIDVIWAGGLYVASKCAEWLHKGFDKLADLVLKIAKKCAEIFDRIIDKIVKVATRFIPALGQILMLVDWVSSGFKDFPAWSDIDDIGRMIGEIKRLQQTIANLVEAAKKYVEGFQEAVDAVRSIPQVDSIDDVAATAGQFRKGAEQMRQARASFDKNAGGHQKQLDDMSAQEPQ